MGSQTILIVDDDQNIQTMLRVCLAGADYRVQSAADGAEALSLLDRVPVDLVLLDLSMPVMNGMTALTLIGDRHPATRPKVVVMTANGSVRAAIQSIRLGAADFLEKPFTPEDVRLSVASVLEDGAAPAGLDDRSDFGLVLCRVREALQAGTLGAAEALLMRAGTIADDDPAFLNLAGLLHEARGRKQSARRFYEKSASHRLGYPPAQMNLRRLSELDRFGSTSLAVALGDETTVSAPLDS